MAARRGGLAVWIVHQTRPYPIICRQETIRSSTVGPRLHGFTLKAQCKSGGKPMVPFLSVQAEKGSKWQGSPPQSPCLRIQNFQILCNKYFWRSWYKKDGHSSEILPMKSLKLIEASLLVSLFHSLPRLQFSFRSSVCFKSVNRYVRNLGCHSYIYVWPYNHTPWTTPMPRKSPTAVARKAYG